LIREVGDCNSAGSNRRKPELIMKMQFMYMVAYDALKFVDDAAKIFLPSSPSLGGWPYDPKVVLD
jgi:hypothetical protein